MKNGGMFVDVNPGETLAGGSVIQCHVEQQEPEVSFVRTCSCTCTYGYVHKYIGVDN